MMQNSLRHFSTFFVAFFVFGLLIVAGSVYAQTTEIVEVDSLEELAEYAGKSNVSVRLKPGEYRLDDASIGDLVELPHYKNGELVASGKYAVILHFSGNRSRYDFSGSTIKLDTQLHRAFGNHKLYEFLITGHGNTLEGLTLHDDGDDVPINSAIMMVVLGNQNVISNADLYVHGSFPYGYGHLLGKGGRILVKKLHKHSGLLVLGQKNKLLGCRVVQHAFGHGIVLQGAVDTLIEDCYVEGEMRTTDDMLAETSGPAFDADFASDYPPGRIMPGQIKALAEDGIRTYASGRHVPHRTARVTVIDCTIKNMRSGVCLGFEQGPSRVINTTVVGYQERGFSIGSHGRIENSRGDAMYGPLLTFLGRNYKNATIDLELINTVSEFPVPRLLEINGTGHKITLKNYDGQRRPTPAPITFGESDWGDIHLFRAPHTDPAKYSGAKNCTLVNHTGMPIVFSDLASDCKVITNGPVLRDDGENNRVQRRP